MVSAEVFSFSPSTCPRASKINSLKNFLTIYLLLLPSHNAHHQKSVKACQDEFYIVHLMKSISKPPEPHSSSGYSHSSPLSHRRLFFFFFFCCGANRFNCFSQTPRLSSLIRHPHTAKEWTKNKNISFFCFNPSVTHDVIGLFLPWPVVCSVGKIDITHFSSWLNHSSAELMEEVVLRCL